MTGMGGILTVGQAGTTAERRCRVLVADKENLVRQLLVRILDEHGIDADTVGDGRKLAAMAARGCYDLVIMDLMLPGQADRFAALRQIIRVRPDQEILVLSGLADPQSKMVSLSLGADDYVPKPFHEGELVARVRARLRAAARTAPGIFAFGRLRLDIVRQQADAGEGPVPLTSREFQLLFELMRRPGAVVSKEVLITRLWGTPLGTTSNVVDVYVRRLRSRLGADVITTVRGAGYRIAS